MDGRQLLKVADEDHAEPAHRPFVTTNLLEKDVHLLKCLGRKHRDFVDNELFQFAPVFEELEGEIQLLADRGLLGQLGLGDLLRHLAPIIIERKVFRVRQKAKETMNRSTVDIDGGHARRGSQTKLFRAAFEVLANAMDDFGFAGASRPGQKK